jgi:nucleoside-diphosphate-sugar epimerase
VKVLIFGATRMVGQGVLRECLAASDVSQVTVVGRSRVEQQHPKLQQLVHADLMNLQAVQAQLRGFDACFFYLGVSSSGMTGEAYKHLTYDITMAAASMCSGLRPRGGSIATARPAGLGSGPGSRPRPRLPG